MGKERRDGSARSPSEADCQDQARQLRSDDVGDGGGEVSRWTAALMEDTMGESKQQPTSVFVGQLDGIGRAGVEGERKGEFDERALERNGAA